MTHFLATQAALALGKEQGGQVQSPLTHSSPWAQTLPHVPQLRLSFERVISQPLTTFLSQSPKPAAQLWIKQPPPAQPIWPWGTAPHACPQAPQLPASARM